MGGLRGLRAAGRWWPEDGYPRMSSPDFPYLNWNQGEPNNARGDGKVAAPGGEFCMFLMTKPPERAFKCTRRRATLTRRHPLH